MSSTEHPDLPLSDRLEKRAATLDKMHMGRVIEGFPAQLTVAADDGMPEIPAGDYTEIAIFGLGGSALPAEVLADAFGDRISVPVRAVRHYEVPKDLAANAFLIVSSFSGNTEEVLEAANELSDDPRQMVVVTAGGKLEAWGVDNGKPVVRIPVEREPAGFQPRSAIGYMVAYFARILHAAGLLDDPVPELKRAAGFLAEQDFKAEAQETAAWLQDKVPVVYSSPEHLDSIARIVKIKFNENSKRPASYYAIPEVNHNEMIGFTQASLARFGVLYFHDPDSHPKIQRRFEVMRDVFADAQMHHVGFRQWTMPGGTGLEKVLASLMFGEQCSYYLALLDGFDPTPVDLVEAFKRVLAGGK